MSTRRIRLAAALALLGPLLGSAAPLAAPLGAEDPESEREAPLPGIAQSPTWERTRLVRAEGPVLPSIEERQALRDLAALLLRSAPRGHLPPEAEGRARALGLSLEREGDRLWLVEPVGEAPRGLGMLAIRLGPLPEELVLQAPHPYYDEHTGRIVGALFDAGGARAAMISSYQRYVVPGVDPSSQPATALQAMTAALPLALPDPLVVQIHGFGPKRSPAPGVVSHGSARSGGELQARALALLGPALQAEGLRGPDQVPLLAGMANLQSWVLADRTRFLHLELSAQVRERLRREEEARARLLQALRRLAAREEGGP